MLRSYMYAIPDAKQNVRVPDVRFAEYPAPAVAGTLGLRARGGLEVVHEPSDGAAFDESRDVRRHRDAGTAVFAARARRVSDGRVVDFALDGDVDLTVGPGQPFDEHAPQRDQIVERRLGGPIEVRGNRRQRGCRYLWKGEVDGLTKLGGRTCALEQRLGIRLRCGRACDSHPALR